MHMKRTLIIGTALAALLLSGCEALQEERQNFLDREEKITNVVGNVWRIEAVWPGHVEGNHLADHLHDRPEYKGLTGTFEIDDLTTLENTQGK